jgi:hypothetical protein
MTAQDKSSKQPSGDYFGAFFRYSAIDRMGVQIKVQKDFSNMQAANFPEWYRIEQKNHSTVG